MLVNIPAPWSIWAVVDMDQKATTDQQKIRGLLGLPVSIHKPHRTHRCKKKGNEKIRWALFFPHIMSHMGMSENGVYPQWNSHLVGIMISKTIGCRGLAYFQTNPFILSSWLLSAWNVSQKFLGCRCLEPTFCKGFLYSTTMLNWGYHINSMAKKSHGWLAMVMKLWTTH